jgi:hypothetical protein
MVFVDGIVVFVDSADSPSSSPCFTIHVVEFGGLIHQGVWQTGTSIMPRLGMTTTHYLMDGPIVSNRLRDGFRYLFIGFTVVNFSRPSQSSSIFFGQPSLTNYQSARIEIAIAIVHHPRIVVTR